MATSTLALLSKSGVYIIRDDDGCVLYVGSSNHIGKRLFADEHEMRAFIAGMNGAYIEIEVFEKIADARAREDDLIQQLQPPKNTRGISDFELRRRASGKRLP